jgi:methylated-DNA-[protein]-cysteine S-methyltransferase
VPNQISIQSYKTKIGELLLGSFDDKLCLLDYKYRKMRAAVDNRIKTGLNAEFTEQNNELLETTRLQIDEYLKGNRTKFELPLLTVGTDFQKSVWNALLEIPYGSTSTYLQLAKSLNHEKAVRAVASANGANSLCIVIPCHRIIESNGGLGGYAGGIPIKKRLLELERSDHTLSDDQKYDFIGSKDKKYNGSFFTAVKTTGIYCLPSCSARKPKRENVFFYDTKEEAILNGFRACKVCKP